MARQTLLSDTPARLIVRYKKALKKNNVSVEQVILFGSYAKGDPTVWSDLDLCIVSKDFGKDRHEELVHLLRIGAGVDPMIEPHPFHPKDLEDPYDPLAVEIRKHGKVVWSAA